MDYISTKEAAKKWGISTTRITILATEGRIPGAYKLGKNWLIPATATKPPVFRARQPKDTRTENDRFSFPLYHFRPDFGPALIESLSEKQKKLLQAESACFECRFEEAYPLLESLLASSIDSILETGCLWNAAICCIALNRPGDFSRYFLRLQVLLRKDFPHRSDLTILSDTLKTYVETLGSAAKGDPINAGIHSQCLPLSCLQAGYVILSREVLKPGCTDTSLLELNLRFLETTGAVITVEWMHIYLLCIYSLRGDQTSAEKHAGAVIRIVFESKLLFPLITYYRYCAPVLSPILSEYPKEFQDHCLEILSKYEQNFTFFNASLTEGSDISRLDDTDYPLIYAILMDQPNNTIAENLGVHPQTVQGRITRLCKSFGVKSKRELKDYLRSHM